jgi:hypothetical protein
MRLEETHAYRARVAHGKHKVYWCLALVSGVIACAAYLIGSRDDAVAYVLAAPVVCPLLVAVVEESRSDPHHKADFRERYSDFQAKLVAICDLAEAITPRSTDSTANADSSTKSAESRRQAS